MIWAILTTVVVSAIIFVSSGKRCCCSLGISVFYGILAGMIAIPIVSTSGSNDRQIAGAELSRTSWRLSRMPGDGRPEFLRVTSNGGIPMYHFILLNDDGSTTSKTVPCCDASVFDCGNGAARMDTVNRGSDDIWFSPAVGYRVYEFYVPGGTAYTINIPD